MKPIELIEQNDNKGCQCACLAMLSGLPLEKLEDRHLTDLVTGQVRFHEVALKYGVVVKTPDNLENIYNDHIYVLIVPSGARNELHMVLVDTRFNTVTVYDPSRGFKQVAREPLNFDEVQLKAFVVRYQVVMAPHLEVF